MPDPKKKDTKPVEAETPAPEVAADAPQPETTAPVTDEAQTSSDITAHDAQAALERDKLLRISKCSAEIQEVLQKYNCDFDVSVMIRHESVLPQLQVVSK